MNVFTNLQSPAKNNTLSLCDATFWPSQNEKPQPLGGFNQPTKVEYRPYKVKHWIGFVAQIEEELNFPFPLTNLCHAHCHRRAKLGEAIQQSCAYL